MNNFKNLLIAVLTGLLALSLFSQPAQSAPKTYDAVKLAQYSACVISNNDFQVALTHANGGIGELNVQESVNRCKYFRP